MKDDQKTKKQLIEELNERRQRVAELEYLEEEIKHTRLNQEKFTKAFLQSSLPVGITTLKEGQFVEVSDAFLRLMGRRRDEVVGRTATDIEFITEEQRRAFFKELNKKGRVENLEMKVRAKDGVLIEGLFNTVMMNLKNEKYLLTVMTDITARKQAEEALRESQKQLHQITDNIPAFVTYVNAKNLHYKFVNKPYADAIGKSPEEMIGRQVNDILSEGAYLRALPYIDRARSGERIQYENMVPIHGESRWFSIHYIPEIDEQGTVINIIVLAFDITNRKRAEESLRLITDNMTDIIRVTNLQGVNLYVSPSHAKVLGYKPEERVGKSFFDILHPDDLEYIMNVFSDGLVNKKPVKLEYRIKHAKGHYLWLETMGDLVRDDHGEVTAVIHCSRDISDRKATEEKLKKSEEKHRSIFENAVEGIFQTTFEGRFLSANPALADIFGYDSPEDLMASITNIGDQLYAKHEEREENLLLINAKGVVNGFEAQGCRKDGSSCWISINTRIVRNDSDPTYYEGFVADITERKRTEEALRESEGLFRSLVDYMHDTMIILDWDGSILFANRGAARIIGYERAEELVGHNMVEYIHSDSLQKAAEDLKSVKAGKMGFLSEYQLSSVTGQRIWVESIGGKIIFRGDDANLVCIRDITDRKQAEADKEKLAAQNRQIQKAESLGRMAGAIAHTFNNYLGVVIGNLELAMDDLTQSAGLINILTAAMQAAGKAAEVSDLMLTYLGHSFDKVELLDLSEACRQNLSILQAIMPGKVILESDLPSPGPAVMANKNQIQQILTNLLTNAWEAVDDDRGSIHLNIKTFSPLDIYTTHRYPTDWQPQDTAYACLEVIDTGVGITDRDKENLFDPFFTSKFIGRGMGLPVVMGIVQAHGGAITVESEPGRGSTFRVFVPVYAERTALHNENAGSGGDTLVNQVFPTKMEVSGTILLVEDEELVRNMAAAMLERLGFTVLKAKDGVEAVEIFRQHQDEIRCVLSDLTMPHMNGWQTMTALRKLAPDIPVILSSGYDEAHVMAGDHPEWPQAFLGKPYKLKGLSDAIGQALVRRK